MRLPKFLLCLVLASAGHSQTYTRANIATIFGFENSSSGLAPAGWYSDQYCFADNRNAHTGSFAARIERTASSANTFSTLDQSIPLDFAGTTMVWSGWVKTANVSSTVALWIREDDDAGNNVQFATTQGLGVNGTTGWTQYSVTIPWNAAAQKLWLGFLLVGPGQAWVDDLQLTVDGVPVAQAPPRVLTPLDTDHQFDGDSGVHLTALSNTQVANLATLAKVWGFVKYHHPAVAGGQHHWDYDLFRIMPNVLAASDTAGANAAISTWVASAGTAPNCTQCATPGTSGMAVKPDLGWLADTALLGAELSQRLQNIYANRPAGGTQFYISLVSGASNPSFDHELTYAAQKFPDSGYQLLALFRFWNMVQYFYPNREIMSDDPANTAYWSQVLTDSIPRIGLAQTSLAYQQEMIRFIVKINDTHANLWSSIAARPPLGSCYLPVDLRFVEGSAFVLRNTELSGVAASGLLPGDLITQLDGVPVSDLVTQWTPMYADSNQAARLRDMAEYMTRGNCGAATVVVDRGGQTVTVSSNRLATNAIDFIQTYSHDRPGPAFQMVAPDIAYVKISTVKQAECAADIQAAAGTKGLIIDIRDYPTDFPIYTLGGMLVKQPTPFTQFTAADLANPSVFRWIDTVQLTPSAPHYDGKVAILVDETTQSSAEFHAMAFRAVPGAVVIGSTTAGADGNVSTVPLPGSLSSYISGLGVFYPDHRPTQRVGIVPDMWVTPTIEGLRAGRDELVEAAMREIRRAAAGEQRQKRPARR